MAAKLEKLAGQIAKLQSGLEGKGEQVCARYDEEYAKLKADRESLASQIGALKEAGAETLKELRSRLEEGYNELGKSLNQTWKRFRKEKDAEPPTSP